MKPLVLAVALTTLSSFPMHAQRVGNVLEDVLTVAVTPTVIGDSRKVKEPAAVTIIETALRNALIASGLRIGDSATRVHLILDEFTSGSVAKRALIGFGSGRSTVAARLIVARDGEQLAAAPIKARGRLMFSAYEADESQRRHALNEFEERLVEALARLR